MATCVPFLAVPDVVRTIHWYESIGFTCTATNQAWEPGCAINWAELDWQGARFMIGPWIGATFPEMKGLSLYFQLESLDGVREKLQGKATILQAEEETFYGRKEIMFRDLNGFAVTFSCEAGRD